MRTIIVLAWLMIAQVSYAQFTDPLVDTFANLATESMNGYITGEGQTDNSEHVVIAPPDYFDFQLVRTTIGIVVDEYSDISFVRAWRKDDDGDYNAIIDVAGSYAGLTYMSDVNKLFIYRSTE